MSSLGRALKTLALGVVIGLLGCVAISLPSTSEIEQHFELRWLFGLRGATQGPPEVVIVAIDEQSGQELGLPNKPSEWPRNVHAQLVDRLVRDGARLICFDLTFETPSRIPENDLALAAAIGRAGNVVLIDSLEKENAQLTSDPGRASDAIQIERIRPPLSVLEDAALAHAPFPLPKESRVDGYWTFKTSAGDRLTLPAVVFQIYAFDAYDGFLDLLRGVAPQLPLAPPADARTLLSASDAGGLISTLRRAFLTDPRLGGRMTRALDSTSDQELVPKKKRLIRGLLGLYQSSELTYLNFYGPARSIATVPYYQVLKAPEYRSETDPAAPTANGFAGKVVFVGFSARSQPEQDRIRDDYETVFSQRSGLNLSGVEIAATAFANLLDNRPIRPIPFPLELEVVAIWGLALGTACRRLRPLPAALAVLLLVLAYLAIALRQFTVAGMWLPLLIPLCLQAPLALFGGALLNYRDARDERKRIKQAFGYFLPDKVVDRLAENVGPIDSTDQLVYAACLATDMEKYTTLAETMTPQELGRLMNEYFAELFKPVERLGGVVSEVVGDAMLAIWAASSPEASVRVRACEAALDIAEAARRFNQARVGAPELLTRLGLHSGQMLLASIGASHHYEYQPVGDMVNTASRIQGLGKYLGTRILASAATVDGLDLFLTRPVGSFLLAGKSTAVSIVELGGRMRDANPQTSLLYRRFAEALQAYRSRQWRGAADQFSEILKIFPEDGPAQFYLRRCEQLVLNPPDAAWDPNVRLDQK